MRGILVCAGRQVKAPGAPSPDRCGPRPCACSRDGALHAQSVSSPPANEDSAYIKSLGVAILAAHTPADVELAHTDDLLDPIDLRRLPPADLVGLSVFSKTARRAYALADAYRAAGARVVLGGIHATALPDEAGTHADAVVVGEAEGLWERVVADARRGRLEPVYRHDGFPSLAGLPWPRRDRALFHSRRYVPFDVVQTMRGCPFPCEFCSVNVQAGAKLRMRPTHEVIAEVERLGRLLFFADDNVLIDPRRARELLEGLAPLRKSWIGQASLAGLDDAANVALLRRSGCQALLIGFESLSEASLRGAGKRQNVPGALPRRGRAPRRRRHRHLGLVRLRLRPGRPLGLRPHRRVRARGRADRWRSSRCSRPTRARPSTRASQGAGRLTMPRWWLEEDHDRLSPYFVPQGMTREELRAGWRRAWRDFYSLGSIVQRWRPRLGVGWLEALCYLPLNAFMAQLTRRKILGGKRLFRPAERRWTAPRARRRLAPYPAPSALAALAGHSASARIARPTATRFAGAVAHEPVGVLGIGDAADGHHRYARRGLDRAGRVGEVPGAGEIVGPRAAQAPGDVEHVDPGRGQRPADPGPLLEGEAAGQPIVGAEAEPDRLLADDGAHRGHHLEQEPAAPLQVPAVAIGALVRERRQELREQVAVGAVDLDQVEAGRQGTPRGRHELGAHLGDLRDAERVRRGLPARLRDCRRPDRRLVVVGGAGAGAGVRELDADGHARVVDRLDHPPQAVDQAVVVQPGLARRVAPASLDVAVLQQQEAGPALGPGHVVLEELARDLPLGAAQILREGREDDPIAEGAAAVGEGLEEMGHGILGRRPPPPAGHGRLSRWAYMRKSPTPNRDWPGAPCRRPRRT